VPGLPILSLFTYATAQAPAAPAPPAWGYDHDGEDWSTSYPLCAGKMQSPIDISFSSKDNGRSKDLSDVILAMNYFHFDAEEQQGFTTPQVSFWDNGHTVQVNTPPNAGSLHTALFDCDYQLVNFHFHSPSDHTIDGRNYALEMHMVHLCKATGKLAVVGILFEEGNEPNEFLNKLHFRSDLPSGAGLAVDLDNTTLSELFATFRHSERHADRIHYELPLLMAAYNGSLTVPPCTEVFRCVFSFIAHTRGKYM
jgi:carbonic anhydrase